MSKALIKLLKKPHLSYSIILLAFVACLHYYYQYRFDFSCVDLAFRVAASKNMAAGKDVYYYVDSGNTKIVNSVVSTPFVNILTRPFVSMPACQIKEAWFWVEFGCFAGCIVVIFCLTGDPWKRYLQSFCLSAFFLASRYWYFHLSSGQIYIVYTFLLFILYFLKAKEFNFLFGLTLAIAIAARPLFLIPVVFLTVFYFNKKICTGLVSGAIGIFLFALATHSFGYWLQYAGAMKYYAEQIPLARCNGKVAGAVHFKNYTIVPPDIYNYCKPPVAEASIYPNMPGITRGLLRPVQSYAITGLHQVIMNVSIFSCMAVVLSLIVALFAKKKYAQIQDGQYMMLFFLIYLITEICTPAPRLPYNFVFWIFGSALVIAKGSYIEVALMLLALSINYIQPNSTTGKEMTELLMLLACFFYLFLGKSRREIVV